MAEIDHYKQDAQTYKDLYSRNDYSDLYPTPFTESRFNLPLTKIGGVLFAGGLGTYALGAEIDKVDLVVGGYVSMYVGGGILIKKGIEKGLEILGDRVKKIFDARLDTQTASNQ